MARDIDGLTLEKWARASGALVESYATSGITPTDGLPAEYGVNTYLTIKTFNNLWRQLTALGLDVAQRGILEWDTSQEYLHPAWIVGSDSKLYRSVQSSTGQDPTTDASDTYWKLFVPTVPLRSTDQRGIVNIASEVKALRGANNLAAITPAGLTGLINKLIADSKAAGSTVTLGEYVFTASDSTKTWLWPTSRGRVVYRDTQINLPAASWEGAASDGTTAWVIDDNENAARAWTVATGARDTSNDILLDNNPWRDAAVADDKLFILSAGPRRIFGFNLSDKAQSREYVISQGANPYQALASDGATLWAVSNGDNKAYAYDATAATTTRLSGKDITLTDGNWQGGLADSDTVWFIDATGDYARAWTVAGVRDATKDINLGAGYWQGGFTNDGAILWIVETGTRGRDRLAPVSLSGGPQSVTIDGTPYVGGHHALTGMSVGDAINVNIATGYVLVYPVY